MVIPPNIVVKYSSKWYHRFWPFQNLQNMDLKWSKWEIAWHLPLEQPIGWASLPPWPRKARRNSVENAAHVSTKSNHVGCILQRSLRPFLFNLPRSAKPFSPTGPEQKQGTHLCPVPMISRKVQRLTLTVPGARGPAQRQTRWAALALWLSRELKGKWRLRKKMVTWWSWWSVAIFPIVMAICPYIYPFPQKPT